MTQALEQAIDSIQVTMNAGGMNTINIILAFVMFGVALGIKPRMFVDVFSKPKSVLLGMLCQLVILPFFTFLLTLAFGPAISWSMALGMILVASCPGGNISNFMSSLSKANIELSVSLTAISTALAVLMTPFNFWLYGNLYLKVANIAGEVPSLTIPLWDVFKTIFILPRYVCNLSVRCPDCSGLALCTLCKCLYVRPVGIHQADYSMALVFRYTVVGNVVEDLASVR